MESLRPTLLLQADNALLQPLDLSLGICQLVVSTVRERLPGWCINVSNAHNWRRQSHASFNRRHISNVHGMRGRLHSAVVFQVAYVEMFW